MKKAKKHGSISFILTLCASVCLLFSSQVFAGLNDGLVGYFPFSGNTGDESGSGNSGTVQGATLAADRKGNPSSAYVFDGTDDYIEIADDPSLDFSGALTLAAWIKLDTLDNGRGDRQRQPIIQKFSADAGFRAYSLAFNDSYHNSYHKIQFILSSTGSPFTGAVLVSDMTLQKDTWYHIAAVFEPAARMKIYINGSDHTGPITYGAGIPSAIAVNDLPLIIGRDTDNTQGAFDGAIDEVRLYNRALSAAEVQELYSGIAALTTTVRSSSTTSSTAPAGTSTTTSTGPSASTSTSSVQTTTTVKPPRSTSTTTAGSGTTTTISSQAGEWSLLYNGQYILIPEGMWGTSGSDLFLYGSNGVAHFDGTVLATMDTGARRKIYSLWGLSSSEIFAIGEIYNPYDPFEADFLVRYNGSSWTELLSTKELSFYDMWGVSANSIIIAGSKEEPFPSKNNSLLFRYDGSEVSEVLSISREESSCFETICGTSQNNMYAVSIDEYGDSEIYHFDGSAGRKVYSDSRRLHDIWCSSEGVVYAIGQESTKIIRFDGNSWSEINRSEYDPEGTIIIRSLEAVWGASPNDIFIAGTKVDRAADKIIGCILHFDGTAWSSTDFDFGDDTRIYAVWGTSAGDVFAAGNVWNFGQGETTGATLIFRYGQQFSGTVTNAWGEVLPGLVVKLNYDGMEYETTTDSEGRYAIPFKAAFGKKARLSFHMKLRDDSASKTYFVMSYNYQDPVQFVTEFTVKDANDLRQDYVIDWKHEEKEGVTHLFCFDPGNCKPNSSSPPGAFVGIEYFGFAYVRFFEAVEFTLLNDIVEPEPVYISPYVKARTAYLPQGSELSSGKILAVDYIAINYENSALNVGNIPLPEIYDTLTNEEWIYVQLNIRIPEVEYHEYSHHIMKCLYGRIPPNPDAATVRELQTVEALNHYGYTNPSTADSFVEGFAMFMAKMMQYELGQDYSGDDSMFGPLEVNRVAWGAWGRDEDKAVAGIFWDLWDGVDAADNDTVELTLGQIMAVLKTYHPNMYSVYQGFVNAYPEQKPGIDQIFISHGFFADKDQGNGTNDAKEPWRRGTTYFIDLADPVRWDGPHETVGQATNYQRPWRYFPPPVPDNFIKVKDAWPYYKISIAFEDQPSLNCVLYAMAKNGMLPVSVPPEQYQATLTIEALGGKISTPNPLQFTNQEFIAQYGTIIEQGYFKEHDFGTTEFPPDAPEVAPELIDPNAGNCLASKLLGERDERLYTLRRFRDQVLSKSAAGNKLISAYYAGSEKLIPVLEKNPAARKAAKLLLESVIPVIDEKTGDGGKSPARR